MTDYILNINKPEGFTSHDVVAKLRGILKIKRIGHCGTLDPMATGVLPVCVGKATKASEFIMGFDKEYIAHVRFGFTSDTQDVTGNVTKTDKPLPSYDDVMRTSTDFLGNIEQIPPMYSAIKIGGQKLYALARSGVEVERPKRQVNIRYIELISHDESLGEYVMKIGCSKGTYIRTLCHDIGEALGCGAVLFGLVRTQTGAFTLDNTITFEDIEKGDLTKGVYSLSDVFSHYPRLTADDELAPLVKNGIRLACDRIGAKNGETYAVYDKDGILLMLAKADEDKLKMIRSFF